jgi:uncharacterized protein (TIGR02996 family)
MPPLPPEPSDASDHIFEIDGKINGEGSEATTGAQVQTVVAGQRASIFGGVTYDWPEPDIDLDDLEGVTEENDDGTFSLLGEGIEDAETEPEAETAVDDDEADEAVVKPVAAAPVLNEKTERAGLRLKMLREITAQPGEDTLRLAFADMLDEHADEGDEPELFKVWAARIRLQCELARTPDNVNLQKLNQESREKYGYRLLELFNALVPRHTVKFSDLRRGMPSSMYAPFSPFLDKKGSIELWKQGLALFPVEQLHMSYAYSLTDDELKDLMRSTGFQNVRDLVAPSLADGQMKLISTQSQLTTLNLGGSNSLSTACLKDIAKLTNLRVLNISGMYTEDAEDMIRALAPLQNLEYLEVHPQLINYLFSVFRDHPEWLPNLKRIDRRGDWDDFLKRRLEPPPAPAPAPETQV